MPSLPFEAIFAASPLPASVARQRDGLMLAVNDAWVSLVGLAREQVVGRKTSEFDLWPDAESRVRYLSTLSDPDLHHLLRFKDGQLHRVRLHTTVMDIEGEPCLVVFWGEVNREHAAETALEAANRALQQRVELLEEGEKLARMGHWTNGDDASTVVWSAGLFDIAGFSPKDTMTRSEGRSGIHPDDMPAWQVAREAGDGREVEYRWTRPDGSVRWFRTHIRRTRVASTEHSDFGVVQDITAQREAADRLEAQLAFVQDITAHVPAVLYQWRLRADGTSAMSFVSDGVRELLEFEPAELLGEDSRIFERIHAADRGPLVSALKAAIEQFTPLKKTLRVVLPLKGTRWCEVMAVPSAQTDGSILWHGFVNDVTESVQVSEALERQHRMLETVRQSQAVFIEGSGKHQAFEGLLASFLAVTGSEYGFVGEVLKDPAGQPYLKTNAMTNIAWDEASRRLHAEHGGMEFRRTDTLLGYVLRTGETVLSNDPANDPRAGGLPSGHPPMRAFMGVPIYIAGEVVAMVGLANKAQGYTEQDLDFLQPLLGTVRQLVAAWRDVVERQRTAEELKTTSALLGEKSEALENTLESMSQGLCQVDPQGTITLYNARFLEMLDLPEALLMRRPYFSEVVKFQLERGDFGLEREWVDGNAKAFLGKVEALDEVDPRLQFTERYLRRNREGRTLEITARLLPDGSSLRTYDDVTSYIQVQEALKIEHQRMEATSALLAERTQYLQDTLESISQGLSKIDASGRFVLYNQRLLEMQDLPEALMAAQPTYYEVLSFQSERGDYGRSFELIEEGARGLIGQPDPQRIPERYLRKTPDGRTLEFRARRSSDGGIVRTCTDVSSYIAAQEALDLERQRLEWVLEATRPGIWETDLSTGTMAISARWAEMLGYTVEELEPVNFDTWKNLIHPEDRDMALERNRAHCAGETPYFECDLRMRHKDGHWVWINDRGRVHRRDADGKAIFMSGTHMDITERVLAQEEVRALNANLERSVRQRTHDLERTLQDMEAISYSIAHDLRAPLRAVNGFAAVISDDGDRALDPDTRELFQRIVRASRNMGQMLTDMLAMLQVVRADLETSPVDLNAVTRDAIEALADSDPRARIEVQELPAAMGDAPLLRQVVQNLLDNALKYSADRSDPRIWIGYDAAKRAYFIRDNGIGFDMAHAGKLFGLFQRLHAGSKVPGMGVGLAIVSRIIERHGGRIWAESRPDHGSTFWWTLPPSS